MNALKNALILLCAVALLLAGLSAVWRSPGPTPLQQHHLSALILESRQTAVVESGGGIGVGWAIAALVALLLSGLVLLWLHFGANYLRQLRLTRKATKRRSRPAPRLPELPVVPEMRSAPLLQEVNERENS